jgi:dTDP-4-dehydrorhamnose 3,5-epimerase
MAIENVQTLVTNSLTDHRGEFVKVFSSKREVGLPSFRLEESFYSTTRKGVARGMHLQVGEGASNRIITCLEGQILDVLIDLREGSNTFLEIQQTIMGPDDVKSIYVPAGVAHGFVALENSLTHYLSDYVHIPELDKGIHMESLGLDFPFKNLIVSERDRKLPTLDSWLKVKP